MLSAVSIGQGEEQRGWFQGCTHLLPLCYAHNRAAGLFDTLDFFQFSCSITEFVLYISVVSYFTASCSLPVPKIESLEKILSRFRKDE